MTFARMDNPCPDELTVGSSHIRRREEKNSGSPETAPTGTGQPATLAARGTAVASILWRQRLMVLVPIALFLLLACVYLLTEPTRYQSTAQFTVTPSGSRLSGDVSDNGSVSKFLTTQSEKVQSREILALALAEPIGADAGLPAMVGKQVRDLDTFRDDLSESPLTTIHNFAEVSVGKKDQALSVSYESPYQKEAPIIANAIVQAFIDYQARPRQSSVTSVIEGYKAEKLQAEGDLAKFDAKISALERDYGVLSNNGNDNVVIMQLSAIQLHLNEAHAQTLQAKADLDEATRFAQRDPRLLEASRAQIPSAEDEETLRQAMAQMQGSLQEMRLHYLPDHPAVQAMQKKLQQAAVTYLQAVNRRYLRCKAAEEDIRAQFDQQQKRALDVSKQAAAYGHLKEDADRLHQSLDTIERHLHATELQQAAGSLEIDFFDRAEPRGAHRSHPNPPRTFAISLLLGLLLGCAVALLRDWADDRLHSADEIKSSLNLALLGTVPKMPPGDHAADCAQRVVNEPEGEVAEAFRGIRTAIQFGAPRDRSKTILIASPDAGDGKSMAAANLAAALALAGRKILLVDANLRSPGQNAIFSLRDGRPGLASLLSGQGTWDQSIQRSAVQGLDILAAGPKTKNPSDLLNSPMFGELLEMAAEKYDHIIIDSPAVMGPADARIIAANCDLTVLVVRAEKSTRKLATFARDGLAGVGARVLGAIVNGVSRRFDGLYQTGYSRTAVSDDEAGDPARDTA